MFIILREPHVGEYRKERNQEGKKRTLDASWHDLNGAGAKKHYSALIVVDGLFRRFRDAMAVPDAKSSQAQRTYKRTTAVTVGIGRDRGNRQRIKKAPEIVGSQGGEGLRRLSGSDWTRFVVASLP